MTELFYPARGDAKLKLGDARKAIREYRKATGNISGTIELPPSNSSAGAMATMSVGSTTDFAFIFRFFTGFKGRLSVASTGVSG